MKMDSLDATIDGAEADEEKECDYEDENDKATEPAMNAEPKPKHALFEPLSLLLLYVLVTVLLASALFCGGTASKFDGAWAQRLVLVVGLTAFVLAVIRLFALPIQH